MGKGVDLRGLSSKWTLNSCSKIQSPEEENAGFTLYLPGVIWRKIVKELSSFHPETPSPLAGEGRGEGEQK